MYFQTKNTLKNNFCHTLKYLIIQIIHYKFIHKKIIFHNISICSLVLIVVKFRSNMLI